ncbi:hypothetical protein WAF17_16310 [Bernardetia sp. ABR2-2B]|uniref:hypothetical protein n=1 Tax=Bernardetia sp. ABR2-2B TaxID=3127472 RepID=UPI0030D26C69
MVEQNESIEELKDVVSFLCDTGEAIDRIYEDGKAEADEFVKEGTGLLIKSPKLTGLPKAIEQRKLLVNPAKRKELNDFVAQDLDLLNDGVEEVVENGLNALDALTTLGQSVHKLRQKKVA